MFRPNGWRRASEPRRLDAIVDTTPVVEALEILERGGRLVINAIRKEDVDKNALLGFDYPEHLWMEKEIKSVADVTRSDVREFLRLASEIPLKPEVQEYELAEVKPSLGRVEGRDGPGRKGPPSVLTVFSMSRSPFTRLAVRPRVAAVDK